MGKTYRYKPEYGKGDHLRQGADNEKYRENYDRIFTRKEEAADYCDDPGCSCKRPLD